MVFPPLLSLHLLFLQLQVTLARFSLVGEQDVAITAMTNKYRHACKETSHILYIECIKTRPDYWIFNHTVYWLLNDKW